MATQKQIAANRYNAKFSTGPRTEDGKRRSRRNALRHGLTAETIIDVLEDAGAYRALQRKIFADYRPASNFEIELVARLVSLLWRLRRVVAIESGLMGVQAKALRKHMTNRQSHSDKLEIFYTLVPSLVPNDLQSDQVQTNIPITQANDTENIATETSNCRLADMYMKASRVDSSIFESLGRYETRLWRQVVQTILLLDSIGRGINECVDYKGRYFRLKRPAEKRRQALWPPFTLENK
jgi:hypothetical protein